jgi:uncharacterized protein YgbK (DUF1537 family)
MCWLAILADDLTGAADCGLQATRRGLRTVVAFGAPGTEVPGEAEVLAWDLDTRSGSAAAAYAATVTAARAVAADDHVYLKVDSTLRGHIGAAIDAALEGTGARVAVVAPAFPAMGRTTVGGRHLVGGAPIDSVEAGRELAWPTSSSDLTGLLKAQSRHAVAHLDLDTLRAGGAVAAVGGLLDGAGGILACDSERDSDLRRLVAELLAAGERVLWVGSAGLAESLTRELTADAEPRRSDAPLAGGAVLTVAGSIAASTRAQVQALLALEDVAGVAVDPALLAVGGDAANAEVARAGAALGAALGTGADAVLYVPVDEAALAAVERIEQTGGGSLRRLSARIAHGLAQIVAAQASEHAIGAMVLTGGETGRAVCDALGIWGMELFGEVEAGVPVGRALGRSVNVVTKAGAFGESLSLVNARHSLKARTLCPVR